MRNKMIIEYEQYYCKICCKLFNDIVHNSYYTYNDFIDNQARLTLDVDYKRKLTKPNYHNQCPYCFSIHNVNVKEAIKIIKAMGLKDKNGRFIKGNMPKNKTYLSKSTVKAIKTAMKTLKYY